MTTTSAQNTLFQFRPGEVIFEEGSRGDCMYVITSGNVEILKTFGGTTHQVNVLERGDFFGEMALLQNEVRTATAKAVSGVGLLKFEKKDFERLMQSDVEIPIRIMRRMANSLQVAESQLASRAQVPPPGRQPLGSGQGQAEQRSIATLAELTLEDGSRWWSIRRKTTTLGRLDNVTGIVPDVDLDEVENGLSVSRLHAQLVSEAAGFQLIEEPGVKNGTWVNGYRLSPGVAFALNHRDHLKLGLVSLRFADPRP